MQEHGVILKPFGIVRQSAYAMKPTNNADPSAAESVEPRAGTKGNADQQNTRRAQHRESVSQAMARIRQALAEPEICRQAPEVRAVCVKAHVRICAGGGEQSPSLPRHGTKLG